MVKVKICGIHSNDEAKKAIEYGADFLGLLIDIPETNLSLNPSEAKKIISYNNKGKFIILTIEMKSKKLLSLVNDISPWGIQLLRPTNENVNFLSKNSEVKIIPVVHITNKIDINQIESYNNADYILLDSRFGNHLGGTGKVHDWSVSKKIVNNSKIPIFLAGGLNKDNVKEAIKLVNPFAIDAESSLRNSEGFRDFKKIKKFINKAKN
jgi:phosphoribosylanthranilate isomerase